MQTRFFNLIAAFAAIFYINLSGFKNLKGLALKLFMDEARSSAGGLLNEIQNKWCEAWSSIVDRQTGEAHDFQRVGRWAGTCFQQIIEYHLLIFDMLAKMVIADIVDFFSEMDQFQIVG